MKESIEFRVSIRENGKTQTIITECPIEQATQFEEDIKSKLESKGFEVLVLLRSEKVVGLLATDGSSTPSPLLDRFGK